MIRLIQRSRRCARSAQPRRAADPGSTARGRARVAGSRSLLVAGMLALVLAGAAGAHHHGSDYQHGEEHREAPFDYYILSLSWSPTFCATHPGDAAECGKGRGFIVHGLWPQAFAGGGPEHCDSGDQPDRETMQRALSAMVDEHLVRHEWATHGTCTGLSAHDYFVSLIRAAGSLTFPDDLDGSRMRRLSAGDIASEMLRANPQLPPRSLAVRCKGEEFEELRVCFSPDLKPTACGNGVHTQCRKSPLLLRAAKRTE